MGFLVGSSRLFWASWHSLVFSYAGYNRCESHKGRVVATKIAQLITVARAGFSQGNDGSTNFTTANVPSMVAGGMFPTDTVRSTTLLDPCGMP